MNILEVRNLETNFRTDEGTVHAVNGINFDLEEGETLGSVGESGCGKSVHALSIMRLIQDPPGKIEAGEIYLHDRNLLKLSDNEMRQIRGSHIAMVFQDPMTSLNPVFTVGDQISEALMLHQGMDKKQASERSAELLSIVGIPDATKRLDNSPHQFS